MTHTKEMPIWVHENRAQYLSKAKESANFLDAVFYIYFYNHHQCYNQLPKIQPEEVFDSYQQDELDIAYKKCEKLVRSGYMIGETLYRIRNENSEEAITEIAKFKADNLGFSDFCYQRAMSHGETAARF